MLAGNFGSSCIKHHFLFQKCRNDKVGVLIAESNSYFCSLYHTICVLAQDPSPCFTASPVNIFPAVRHLLPVAKFVTLVTWSVTFVTLSVLLVIPSVTIVTKSVTPVALVISATHATFKKKKNVKSAGDYISLNNQITCSHNLAYQIVLQN